MIVSINIKLFSLVLLCYLALLISEIVDTGHCSVSASHITPLRLYSCSLFRIFCIIIKHVSQNIFSILQSLGHLCIVTLECLVEGQRLSFSFLIDISDQSALWVQQYLSVILKVYLHDLITQPEHDGMFSSHPFFDIDLRKAASFLLGFNLLSW